MPGAGTPRVTARRAVIFVSAILWLWPAVVFAQSDALSEAYRRGQALYEAGQYEQAIPFWRKVVDLGEREFGPDHPDTATLLNNLAGLYYVQGRYEAAEPLLKQALAIREKALGKEHPLVAQSLANYAALLRETGRSAEANKMEARAKSIRAKHAKENPAN